VTAGHRRAGSDPLLEADSNTRHIQVVALRAPRACPPVTAADPVPLNLHYKGCLVNVEIGGESERDKRDTETKRDWEREKWRLMRHTVSSKPRD
jgi:hypothetical protein